MSRKTKLWLCIAGALIIVGAVLSIIGFAMVGGNFTMLSTNKYQTKEYTVSEDFQSIAIVTNTADIDFVASDSCKVVCLEEETMPHSVTVENDTLVIKVQNKKKWHEHIAINFKMPKITVCLPQGTYGNLSISCATGDMHVPGDYAFNLIDIAGSTGKVLCEASTVEALHVKLTTGSIRLEQATAGQLDLSATSGNVTVSGVQCKGDAVITAGTGTVSITDLTCLKLTSNGTTGVLKLSNVVAEKAFSLSRTTGNVELDRCDAEQIAISAKTGSVTGTLLSDKVYITNTTTGRVDVPQTATGGKCEIRTTTGNIKIATAK